MKSDDEKLAEFDAMFEDEPEKQVSKVEAVDTVHAMRQLLDEFENRGNVAQDQPPEVVRLTGELESVAYANIADVMETREVHEYVGEDDEGNPVYQSTVRAQVRPLDEIPRKVLSAIQSIKISHKPSGDTVELKMYDKLTAIDKLMKHHGAYKRDNEQTVRNRDSVMGLLFDNIGAKGLPKLDNNDA